MVRGAWRNQPGAEHSTAQCVLRLTRYPADSPLVRSTRRTAGCGPACPVVWEGRSCETPPIPIASYRTMSSTIISVATLFEYAREIIGKALKELVKEGNQKQ